MKNRRAPGVNLYRGFTLLEVLIALVIFALISITCFKQVAVTLKSMERMELKYKALWIGENAIEELFLVRGEQSHNDSIREYEIDDEKWLVVIEITDTDITNIKQIEAKVYQNNTEDASIISLTRYIGRY